MLPGALSHVGQQAQCHPPTFTFRGKRYRQRCSDGVVLRGDLGHLGQQAQCQLPVSILPASAKAALQVMALRCLVLSVMSDSNPPVRAANLHPSCKRNRHRYRLCQGLRAKRHGRRAHTCMAMGMEAASSTTQMPKVAKNELLA